MKFIDKYNKIQKIGCSVDVPWHVYRILGPKKIFIIVDQVDLGEDSCSLDEARKAIEFYVEQLGGLVMWDSK